MTHPRITVFDSAAVEASIRAHHQPTHSVIGRPVVVAPAALPALLIFIPDGPHFHHDGVGHATEVGVAIVLIVVIVASLAVRFYVYAADRIDEFLAGFSRD